MPTLAQLHGIRIVMYYEDHEPPHFHARSARFRAKFAISDLGVLEMDGTLRAGDATLVREWASANRQALLDNWIRAKRGLPMMKLKGLD